MQEHDFRLKADETLSRLHRALVEAAGDHDFEADLGDALTIEFEDPPAKFVVSPNAPVRQIWVSAQSRSFKLDWDPERSTFALPNQGPTLKELLADAISRQIGSPVQL